MGWEDRQYYRDRSGPARNVLRSIFGGSVPLFTAFGIRVRAHASLIILIICVFLFGAYKGEPFQERATVMGMLAIVVILHEFGHCFTARWVGGEANDILLWPLGGLAFTRPPHYPWPNFATSAGGPAVNVIICVVCGIVVWAVGGGVISFDPFNHALPREAGNLYVAHHAAYLTAYYFFWLFLVSYELFLFNLLPIFPLDGGQMLQAILWPKMGYYRAMHFACVTGMVGGIALAIFGLGYHLNLTLACIGVMGFFYCRSRLTYLKETGGEEYATGSSGMDFSASLQPDAPTKKRRRVSRWKIRRIRRQAAREAAEQQQIDDILAKVSAQGMASLTWSERRALRRATARQRKLELEPSRGNRN